MKVIKYNLLTTVDHGGPDAPDWVEVLTPVSLDWNEVNEEIAKAEAHGGVYTIEEVNTEVDLAPTQMDRIEAQVAYTAMMTGTLLEV